MEWESYYQKTREKKPSQLLIEGIKYAHKGRALDLGAGAMVESSFLTEQGFKVTAIDSSEDARTYAQDAPFELLTTTFDAYEFPEDTFELINARYSLPFNSPETFEGMFARLVRSMKSGGVFIGQFFGPKDEWNIPGSGKTFLSEDKVRELLTEFYIMRFDTDEGIRPIAVGGNKFWHVYHIIARKR